MDETQDQKIEKIINDAIERAWEEAKLRDLMTLYSMWKNGELKQFKSFDDLFYKFYHYDDSVREMGEKEYFTIEGIVVDTICKSSITGKPSTICKEGSEE
jgi:hypothetical protein